MAAHWNSLWRQLRVGASSGRGSNCQTQSSHYSLICCTEITNLGSLALAAITSRPLCGQDVCICIVFIAAFAIQIPSQLHNTHFRGFDRKADKDWLYWVDHTAVEAVHILDNGTHFRKFCIFSWCVLNVQELCLLEMGNYKSTSQWLW